MDMTTPSEKLEYLGFWPRVGASIIDNLLACVILLPLAYLLMGSAQSDFASAAASLAVLVFWYYKQATPGKIVFESRIVDAKTGGKMSAGQIVGRYFAYIVSALPLGLGFFWDCL
jgi:uncharacterized RDD family membrane protein YckC